MVRIAYRIEEPLEAQQNQMTQYLSNPELQVRVQRLIFDMLLAKGA